MSKENSYKKNLLHLQFLMPLHICVYTNSLSLGYCWMALIYHSWTQYSCGFAFASPKEMIVPRRVNHEILQGSVSTTFPMHSKFAYIRREWVTFFHTQTHTYTYISYGKTLEPKRRYAPSIYKDWSSFINITICQIVASCHCSNCIIYALKSVTPHIYIKYSLRFLSESRIIQESVHWKQQKTSIQYHCTFHLDLCFYFRTNFERNCLCCFKYQWVETVDSY